VAVALAGMIAGLEDLGIEETDEAPVTQETEATPPQRPQAVAPAANAEELLAHLRQISLFEGLLPVHLRRIAALAQEVSIGKNQALFEHGDPGDGLYLIIRGGIRISRSVSGIGEEALAILRPGMYFGEMSIIDDEALRSADAIAHEDSVLLKLPKDDLRDLMFVDRELAYELLWRFVRTLSARLRDSNDRLLMLTVSSKF